MALLPTRLSGWGLSGWRQRRRGWIKPLTALLFGLMLVLSCELAWSQPSKAVGDDAASAEVMDLSIYVAHQEAVSFYLDYYPTAVDWSEGADPLTVASGEDVDLDSALSDSALFDSALEDGTWKDSVALPPAFRAASTVAKLEQIMQAMIGCDAEDIETSFDYGFSLSGYCQPLMTDGFQWGGQIQLAPLLLALADMEIDRLTVSLDLPDVGSSVVVPPIKNMSGLETLSDGFMAAWANRMLPTYEFYDIAIADPAVTKISYRYGFSGQQVLIRLVGLSLALLVPVGILVWLRRRSLRLYVCSRDRTLWFGYQRSVTWLELATWAVWFMLLVGTAASDWLPLLLPPAVSGHVLFSAVSVPLVIVPPMVVGVISRLLSYRVMKAIAQLEYTLPEILAGYVASVGLMLLPLMVVPALQLFEAGYGTLAKALLGVAAVVFLILKASMGRLKDMTPYAITTGELRDRLFALAKPTGVQLQHVYLLPMRRSRMVNAFAVKNNTVMVTDYLLKHLNKNEVDGIMAHELAHLQLGHPRKLMWQTIVTILVLSLGLSVVLSGLELLVPGLVMLQVPLTIAITLAMVYSTSRRFEYQADAQAALITGNPKALISGLVKVARLNQMPLQWGKWGESMMTHPSMQRRVLALAQRYDVPTPEVDALIAKATDGLDASMAVAEGAAGDERYDLRVINPIDDTLPLFSSEFKQKTAGRLSWLLIWGVCFGTVVLGLLAHGLPIPGLQWLGYGAATVILALSYRWLLDNAPVWGYDALGKQLRARLRSQGFVPSEGWFVGFAPGGELRNYEGHTNWDVGFLFLRDNRLCYIGEQLKFAITSHQVTHTVVKPDTTGLVPSATVVLTWQGADTERHTFILQPLSARATKETQRLSRVLKAHIDTWQAADSGDVKALGCAGGDHALFEGLMPPVLGDVTSQPLPTFSLGLVVGTWLIFAVVVCAIAILTGSLFISGPLTGFMLTMATAAAWAQCLPALRRTQRS